MLLGGTGRALMVCGERAAQRGSIEARSGRESEEEESDRGNNGSGGPGDGAPWRPQRKMGNEITLKMKGKGGTMSSALTMRIKI